MSPSKFWFHITLENFLSTVNTSMICDITNEAKSLEIFVGLVSSATVGAAATRVLSAPSPQSQDHVIRWPLHDIFIIHVFLLLIQNTHLQLLSQALAQGSRGKRTIDLDGGGPLPPASLLCDFDNDGQVVSKVVDLLNKETIICDVNGLMLKRWKWRQCWWNDVVIDVARGLRQGGARLEGEDQGGRVPGAWLILTEGHLPCS